LSDIGSAGEDGIEKGDLVSMTFERSTGDLPGGNIPVFTVRKSRGENDMNVIGVVFEKMLSEEGAPASPGTVIRKGDRINIATHNAISFMRASAENGPIVPGDYLMPARTPGYAMKADDTAGLVVGRALDELPTGTGSLRAFVSITPTVGISNLNIERLEAETELPARLKELGISKPATSEREKRQAIGSGVVPIYREASVDRTVRLGASDDVIVVLS
jgi:hypothetical protein